MTVKYNKEGKMVKMRLGIDLGGSHIAIGVVAPEKGEILKKEEQDIEFMQRDELSILHLMEQYIEKFSKNYEIEYIGIAAPGNPNQEELLIENLVNLGIEKLHLKPLEKRFNLPIRIKNDSKAAGVAEFKFGSLSKYRDAVFLSLGTGIGSAVFLNGDLLQANRHLGFEIGHMIIDKNGLQCNCGKKGCFETYCSMKRFKENAKKILHIEDISSQELLEKIKNEIKKIPNNESILTQYNENVDSENTQNNKLKLLINDYIDNLIIGLSNVIDIFEPEAISLGGSFVFFEEVFYHRLINEMNKRKYVFNKNSLPEIVLANLKNDAGIIGAVID